MKRSNLVIYEKDIAKVKESVNFSNISFFNTFFIGSDMLLVGSY